MSHPGAPHVPAFSEWVTWWTCDPLVLAGLATGVAIYTRGAQPARVAVGPVASRGVRRRPRRRRMALISPIDRASDILFSAHMVQHELYHAR